MKLLLPLLRPVVADLCLRSPPASLENFLIRSEVPQSAPSSYYLPPLQLVRNQDSPVDNKSPNSSGFSSYPPRPSTQQPPFSSSTLPNPSLTAQESFSLALEELFGSGGIMDETGGGGGDVASFKPITQPHPCHPTESVSFNSQYPSSLLPGSSTRPPPSWDPTFGGQESTRPQLPSPPQPYPTFSPNSSYSLPTYPITSQIFDTFPPTLHSSFAQSSSPATQLPSSSHRTSTSGGFVLPSRDDISIDPALRSHLLGHFFPKMRHFGFSLHVPRFIA